MPIDSNSELSREPQQLLLYNDPGDGTGLACDVQKAIRPGNNIAETFTPIGQQQLFSNYPYAGNRIEFVSRRMSFTWPGANLDKVGYSIYTPERCQRL